MIGHSKFIPFIVSLVIATCCVADALAQTVSTPVVGFSKVNLPTGTVYLVPGFVKAPVFSGSSLVTGQSFGVSGLTSGSFNESNYNDRPNYPKFYVEITSGAYEGYSFDINSNTGSAVSVSGVPAALNGTTVSIAIRPHVVLDDLVQGQIGLVDYDSAVNMPNPDGTTTTRFYASGSWIAEDFSTPAGHTVVYPGNAVALSSSGGSLTTTGVVKSTKTAVPLYSAAVNYVGQMNPSSSTKINNLQIAAPLSPYLDGFNTFSIDGSMTTVGTYFSDGTAVLDAGYSPLDPTASDAVNSNFGFAVSVSSDTVWIMPSLLTQ